MTTHLPHSLQKLLEVTVGMPWPEGDEDDLWHFAASWEAFANELDGIASDLLAEAAAFDAVISGKTGDALHKTLTDDLHGNATQLRDQAEVYAKALKNAAADIQKTKIMIIGMLAVLAVSMASLIASLFGSFAVPAVVAAARVGIGALLRALLVRLVEAGFFNIAKQIAVKTLIGAGVGAGLMVGLDSAIQGVQIAQGHRDGFDRAALKGDAIGGAIAGGLSGLAEGMGGVLGKAGRGLWDQLPRSLRGFRVLGNSILQIPAAALSNPLTNIATHQTGNVTDGILGALEGGGGHSHVHVPNLDVHPLDIAHVPALPAFPHSGETTTTPVTRGHTPIGSTFTTPVRETPVATTGAERSPANGADPSTSVERMAPKGNASSSRAGATPVTTQSGGHAGTDGSPAEQRVPGRRSAADVQTSSSEGNTGNPHAVSEVAPESHPGQSQPVGTSAAAAPSGRNSAGERTAAANQSGGASSSGRAATGSDASGGRGAGQHAATGEHGGSPSGTGDGGAAGVRSGVVPQVGGEHGGSTSLGDQGISRSAAGGRNGGGSANQSGGREVTESGGSGAGQRNVVENHGGGASGTGDGGAAGVRSGVVPQVGGEHGGGPASLGNRGASGATDGNRNGAGEHTAAGNENGRASGSGAGDGRAAGDRPGVVSQVGVEHGGSAAVGDRGAAGLTEGGRSGAGQQMAVGNRGDGASSSGSTAAESRGPGAGGRNGMGQHNVVENDGGRSTATGGGTAPESPDVRAGHQRDGAFVTAPEHRASTPTGDSREAGSGQGVSDRRSVPAEPSVSGRGASGGEAPTESGHGATESRGSEAGAGQRVVTAGGRGSDPQTQDVAGPRESVESQAHVPAAEPQVPADGQRGDTSPTDHAQQRHPAAPVEEPAAGSHGVDEQPTGHPHPSTDSQTGTGERSDRPATTPAVESADGPGTSTTHAELSGTGPVTAPTEHGAEPHHSVEQPVPSGEIHQEHPVQHPHPEPDPTPPSPANRVEQARTERPKVDGDIDGQAVRESVLGLLDLGNSRSDQVLRTLVEQHFSDQNLKETFHRAVDGGVVVDLGARNTPQVRLEVVGLSTPRDVRVEATDFSAARTREPASTSTTNARTAVSTESRGFRIPTPFVSVAVKIAGLVNVRGSDMTATVKHAGETTVVESNVRAHRSTQDATYQVTVREPGRDRIERTDYVSTEVPLLWRGDTVSTGEHGVLSRPIDHAELSGLGDVSRRVEEAFGRFPAGHAGARQFRSWVHGLSSSADDLLSGKPVRQSFKFPGRREPVEVSVSVADTVVTHPAGTAEGKIERKSEVSAESSVGQSVARRWGGGVTISGGDVTGATLGGLANLAVSRVASTTTETRATEKFGQTLSDTYRGSIGRQRVDFTYVVRAHDQVIKVDGTATVWTKDAEPGPAAAESGSVSARMLDRVDAEHQLPEETVSHLVGPVLHRLSTQGVVRPKDLPQIEQRLREFLNDNARELVRGGDGVRFPLSAWHAGAPDVFVRGTARADEARHVGVLDQEARGGRISTAHRDTVEVTRTKDVTVGLTGSVYGSRLKGVGGSVGGEYKSTGRDVENVAHEVGHERTLEDDRPLNRVRYPVEFEVRVGGRWAEPGEPLRWGDGTTLHGEVDVVAPVRGGQPLETHGGAAEPSPRPTWHDGEAPPADEHEGFLPPGFELNSLKPVPDLLGTVTRMVDAPRSSRFAELLRRPLVGAGPARFDEHTGLGRWGRDASQADEHNAARDVLESFTSQPARAGRFERAALYHDTVHLKSHNRAGLVGSRERVARVDLATRLTNARIVRVDDAHRFSATEVSAAERTQETTTGTTVKGKFDASFAPPVKGTTPTRPAVTAGGGIGHLDQTAKSVKEGAKDTATRSRTERGYLVTFDATYTVHTSARRDWHDIAGFRHDGRTRDAAKWVRVPEAATMWVPASEIHRVGRLADGDVARLDPADAERYRQEHRPEPVDQAEPPVPSEPDPVAAPSTVGRGSGHVELHRLTAGTELLTEVATRLTHWAAQHERVPEPNILDLTRQAFGSTVPERPSRRSVEFGPINDRLVNDVLGPTLTGSEFTPALREMLNGGRPVFLEGATPFGKVEQLVVLRADLGPGAYHRRVAGESGEAETTATHRTEDTTTRGWSFDFSGGLTAGTSAKGKPSSSQGFSVNVSHGNREKTQLTRERSETVTAARDGDTVEFLHDLRVTMDVYPYARSGHYRKYLPGARQLAEPWSTEFTLPGSVRSSVASHETIPRGEHPTPPLAQADGSLRAWQRHRDLPRGLSDDVTMHVRPFDAPKLHKVLDDLARGAGGRPPLTPRAVHEIRSATGSLLRTHVRDLLSRDGHVVRGSGRRLAQVKVSADIVRRELVRVLDEPLKSKASEKETAKLTDEHAGEVGLATSANLSALPISNAVQRPSVPLHDASTKMRDWSRTDTAESSTKKDLPAESAADRRYLVRLTPRWQVVPEYRGSKAQEAWSRPVRTGPDTPILVEVDERGLTQLGLAEPERGSEAVAAEATTITAGVERSGSDTSRSRTLGDILGLPAEDVRRHEDAPPADAAPIEHQQAARTPFGLEVIPEGDEGRLGVGEDVPREGQPERVADGNAAAAGDEAEIDRQIEAMWQRQAGRTPFRLDIIPEGDEGPSIHHRLRPADVVEGHTLTGVDQHTGAEATFHSSQARAHQLRTAAGTPIGVSFSDGRGVAEDRRAIRHDHAGTTQLDHPEHEISETVAAPWPRNTLYVTTHGSRSGFHIRLTDGRELEIGGETFGRLLDDLRIFHRTVEHDRPDALALVVCDVGAVDGPGGAAHDFQRALRELGHRQAVVAATDAVGFQIDEGRGQWSTYVDNGGRWRTFSGEPADALAPRHAPPPPPAAEHSVTAPAEHHQDDPSVAVGGQHHEVPAETGEPAATSKRQPETGAEAPVDEARHPQPQERVNVAETSQRSLPTSDTSSRSDHRPAPPPQLHRGGVNYRDLPAHSGRKTDLNRQRAFDEKHDGTAHDRRQPEPIQEPIPRSSGPAPKVVRPRERVAADFAEALEKLGLRPYLSGGAALGLHGGLRPIGDLDFRVAGESGIHSFDEGGKGAAVLKSMNETTLPGKVNEYRADLKKREVESGGQLDQLHAVDSGLTIGTDNWFGHEVSLAAVPGERPRTVSMSMGEAAKDRHIDVLSLEDLRADKAKTILTRTKHGEDSLKKVAQDLIDFLDAADLINRRPGEQGGDIAHHVDQGLKDRVDAYKGANLDGANLHHLSDEQVLDLMKARLVETAKVHVRNGARHDAFHDIIRRREQELQREIDKAMAEGGPGTSSSISDLERRLGEIRDRRANLEEQLTRLSELPTDPAATHAIRPWMDKWNDRASYGPPPESRAVRGPAGAQGPRTMEPPPEPHPHTPVHDLLDLHAPDVTDRLHEVLPNASEHVEKVAKVLAFSNGFRELSDHKSEAQTLAAFDLTKTQFAKAFKDLAKAGLVEPSDAGLHLTEHGFQQLVPTTGPYRVPDPTHIRPQDVVPSPEHEPATSHPAPATRPAPRPGHGSDGAGPSDAHERPAKRAGHDDESWRHNPADTADWFAPRPDALTPDQWRSRRDAAHVRTVDTEIADVTTDSTPGRLHSYTGLVRYDMRRIEAAPGRWVRDFTVKVHLESGDPAAAAAVRDKARAGVDALLNRGYRLPGGDQFHVTLEFTEHPHEAHTTVEVGNHDTDQTHWHPDADPAVLAHETLHYLGVNDEYRDPSRIFLSRDTRSAVVPDEHGMMGTGVLRPDSRLRPRHLWMVDRVADSQVAVPETPLSHRAAEPPTAHHADAAPADQTRHAPVPVVSVESLRESGSVHNTAFENLADGPVRVPTREHYLDHLAASVGNDAPISFVVTAIVGYDDLSNKLPAVLDGMMAGARDLDGRVAFVFGVNGKAGSEAELARSLAHAAPVVQGRAEPVALVPLTWDGKSFPYGEMRNGTIDSPAGRWAVGAMVANGSHPYLAVQDFDAGSRAVPSGEHVFAHVADLMRMGGPEEGIAASRPLMISGGYRVSDAATLVRKTEERISKAEAKAEKALTELAQKRAPDKEIAAVRKELTALAKAREKFEQPGFADDFARLIDEDMRTRQRQVGTHPLLPYTPEPNLFVDGVAVVANPGLRFGRGAAEYTNLGRAANTLYAEELGRVHGAELARPNDDPDHHDSVVQQAGVDAQNNRHPLRGEAFAADFVDGAIETDLDRLAFGWLKDGKLPQSHIDLTTVVNRFFGGDNPQADRAAKQGVSVADYRRTFPKKGHVEREPQRPNADWDPSAPDAHRLGDQPHNTLNQAISTPLPGEFGGVTAGVSGEHKLIAAHNLATSDVATAMARALGSIKNDVLPGAPAPAVGSLYRAVDPVDPGRLRARVLDIATGAQPKVVAGIGSFVRNHPIEQHGHLVNALVQHRTRATDTDPVENTRAANAEGLAAQLIATQLANDVVVHHPDGTSTMHGPLTGKRGRAPIHVVHEVDAEGRHSYRPGAPSRTRPAPVSDSPRPTSGRPMGLSEFLRGTGD